MCLPDMELDTKRINETLIGFGTPTIDQFRVAPVLAWRLAARPKEGGC
jgi:hypothetical protein